MQNTTAACLVRECQGNVREFASLEWESCKMHVLKLREKNFNILFCVSALCKFKEHIEEMSNLSEGQLRMKHDEDVDGQCVHLHRQLKAKDEELRQVHNSMAQWKDKTTARIAHKFELELNAELERCFKHSLSQLESNCHLLTNFWMIWLNKWTYMTLSCTKT